MKRSITGLLAAFLVLLFGIAETFFIEAHNTGDYRILFSLGVTATLGLSWMLSAVSAGLFIVSFEFKTERSFGYIIQSLASIIQGFILIMMIIFRAETETLLYPLPPLLAGMLVFLIPVIKQKRAAGLKT